MTGRKSWLSTARRSRGSTGTRRAWGHLVTHLPPDPDLRCVNGKVAGVVTGLRHVRARRVVIADDDVR